MCIVTHISTSRVGHQGLTVEPDLEGAGEGVESLLCEGRRPGVPRNIWQRGNKITGSFAMEAYVCRDGFTSRRRVSETAHSNISAPYHKPAKAPLCLYGGMTSPKSVSAWLSIKCTHSVLLSISTWTILTAGNG
jgi:hypothetical protein